MTEKGIPLLPLKLVKKQKGVSSFAARLCYSVCFIPPAHSTWTVSISFSRREAITEEAHNIGPASRRLEALISATPSHTLSSLARYFWLVFRFFFSWVLFDCFVWFFFLVIHCGLCIFCCWTILLKPCGLFLWLLTPP